MQDGLVKYDKYEDVVWAYSNVQCPLKTPFTGTLVGFTVEDQIAKHFYNFSLSDNFMDASRSTDFNPYCGCCNNALNGLAVYASGLVTSKTNGISVYERYKPVGRRLLQFSADNLLLANGNHITCGLLGVDSVNQRMCLSTVSNIVFLINGFVGCIEGSVTLESTTTAGVFGINHVTALCDFVGNTSSSSCKSSYIQPTPIDFNTCFQYPPFNSTFPETQGAGKKKTSSMADIAKKCGGVDNIPEFVPGALKQKLEPGAQVVLHENQETKTQGGMTVQCYVEDNRPVDLVEHDFRPLTCIGTNTGILHILDHRMNQIVATMQAQSKPIHSISASGNTVVTSSCTLYNNGLTFEPLVGIYDLRMKRATSQWLGGSVRKVLMVPKSDRFFALLPDGGYFDYQLSSGDYTRVSGTNDSWHYYGIDVSVPNNSSVCNIYTVNCAYSMRATPLPNRVELYSSYVPEHLPSKYAPIPQNQLMQHCRAPFASILRTYEGDLVQVLVQVFFFLDVFDSLRYHACEVEHCVACQVGFALHQLKVAHENLKVKTDEEDSIKGFYKHYEVIQITQFQELVPAEKICHSKACQQLLLWIFEKMNTELETFYSMASKEFSKHVKFVKSICGIAKRVESICHRGHELVTNLDSDYSITYADFLVHLDDEDKVTREYCQECQSHVSMMQRIEYKKPPPLLVITCTRFSTSRIQDSILFAGEGYRLASVLFSVPSSTSEFRFLAYCRVPSSLKCTYKWVLINDGLVVPLKTEELHEVYDLDCGYKELIGLVYTRENMPPIVPLEPTILADQTQINDNGRIVPLPPPTIDVPISCFTFVSEYNMAHNPKAHVQALSFTPLTHAEILDILNGSYMIALDVECVQEDVVEGRLGQRPLGIGAFHANRGNGDGDNKDENSNNNGNNASLTTGAHVGDYKANDVASAKRGVSTVARVSAIRACGSSVGVAFLDHYVHRKRPPKDYLTRFSGIRQGDLDLKNSLHWLTTKKSIYMKIRFLADAGCRFIGHGLEEDFKALNVVVPVNQILDTAQLYRLPRSRLISLQFLASHLLDRKIQTGEHDSYEDAKTALDLLYLSLESKREIESALRNLYNIGYQHNWAV